MATTYFTADTDQVTADSTDYTADQTIIVADETARVVSGTSLYLYVAEAPVVTVEALDSTGAAVSLVGKTLRVVFRMIYDAAEIYTVEAADITIAESNASFLVPTEVTTSPSLWQWCLRNITDGNLVVLQGICNVIDSPDQPGN